MEKAIFIDRDGVLNKLVKYADGGGSPRCIEDFHMYEGIRKIIKEIKTLGYIPLCVTNQPDISRGLLSIDDFIKMNNLVKATGIKYVYYCPHDDSDNCNCRKPKPGMLLQAAEDFDIDLKKSFMIGDSWKDMAAGEKVGCKTVLVVNEPKIYHNRLVALNLKDAWEEVKLILKRENYAKEYLEGLTQIAKLIDIDKLNDLVKELVELRERKGKLFCIGVGGGNAIAKHAECDLRKTCNIETYTIGMSEFSARTNDEGDISFREYLRASRFGQEDALFVFSVGGGDEEKNISVNIVEAVKYAKEVGGRVFGIVSNVFGCTGKLGDVIVFIPNINNKLKTAYTESFQSAILHLLVTHPDLQINQMKWESIK